MNAATRKKEIKALSSRLNGLKNDARYWDLRRAYGDLSKEVLQHLRTCAAQQLQIGRNQGCSDER